VRRIVIAAPELLWVSTKVAIGRPEDLVIATNVVDDVS